MMGVLLGSFYLAELLKLYLLAPIGVFLGLMIILPVSFKGNDLFRKWYPQYFTD